MTFSRGRLVCEEFEAKTAEGWGNFLPRGPYPYVRPNGRFTTPFDPIAGTARCYHGLRTPPRAHVPSLPAPNPPARPRMGDERTHPAGGSHAPRSKSGTRSAPPSHTHYTYPGQ